MYVIEPPPAPVALLKSIFKGTTIIESIVYDGTVGIPQSVIVTLKNGERIKFDDVSNDVLSDLLRSGTPDAFFETEFKTNNYKTYGNRKRTVIKNGI
jgi:hypothetical protein